MGLEGGGPFFYFLFCFVIIYRVGLCGSGSPGVKTKNKGFFRGGLLSSRAIKVRSMFLSVFLFSFLGQRFCVCWMCDLDSGVEVLMEVKVVCGGLLRRV